MDETVFRAGGAGAEEAEGEAPPRRGRNLVAVIGVDDYQHWPRLDNAVSDARGVSRLFREHGFIEPFASLLNDQATQDGIQDLLKNRLAGLLEPDDSLVLFFAGHGHTERRKVGNKEVEIGYLIPVDGQPLGEKKTASWIDLSAFLKDVSELPAMHVLLILDACKSGFALGSEVSVFRGADIPDGYDRFARDLEQRISRQVITSAMDDQLALDSGPVPGHSLFTGCLVQALAEGKADRNRKGFVTTTELGLYVQNAVAGYPKSKQTPVFGSFMMHDQGELLISLRSEMHNELRAREELEIARRGFRLGQRSGQAGRFRFAAGQYRQALEHARLAKLSLPQAEFGLGQALLAAGDPASAEQTLAALVEKDLLDCPPAAWLYLGMAQAAQRNLTGAAETLTRYRALVPNGPDSAWVQEYLGWLAQIQTGNGARRALLIGVNRCALEFLPKISGSVNDEKKLMKPALVQRLGFDPGNIQLLTDRTATRRKVQAAFEALIRTSAPADVVVVHFSGHSLPKELPGAEGIRNDTRQYLILADTHASPTGLDDGVTALELHQWMQAIPALSKLLILDTHASQEMIELAQSSADYSLLLASDTAEVTYEWHIEVGGKDVPCGMLTGALYQVLNASDAPAALTYRELVAQLFTITHEASSEYGRPQTPFFSGAPEQRLLEPLDPYEQVFRFVYRGAHPELSRQDLERLYGRFHRQVLAAWPEAHLAFGRALRSCAAPGLALPALQRAAGQGAGPQTLWEQVFTSVALPDYDAARAGLAAAAAGLEEPAKSRLEPLAQSLARLSGLRRQVVLILLAVKSNWLNNVSGPDDQSGEHSEIVERRIRAFRRALEDVQRILADRFGPQAIELRILAGDEGDEQLIRDELQQMAAVHDTRPHLYCLLDLDTYFFGFASLQDLVENAGPALVWIQNSPESRER